MTLLVYFPIPHNRATGEYWESSEEKMMRDWPWPVSE
jgi:hypothetical protein